MKIVATMRQRWIAFGARGAQDVIELLAGSAELSGTQPGDTLVRWDAA